MKFAAIDIGSNSVRLLLWADGRTLYKKMDTTRLGEGIARTGVLSAAAIERTAAAVARFAAEARQAGAAEVYAFATAAVRSAENGGEFVEAVRRACGLRVDVLSCEREALAGLAGALGDADGGVVDVGGASTELTVRRGKEVYARSADIGAVRLKDLCGEDEAALRSVIAEKLALFDGAPACADLCAVGGTATSLAALEGRVAPYDPARIDGFVLTAACIEGWGSRLLGMTQAQRLALPGMDARRADILGGAALLLAAAARKAGAEKVTVRESDNLEGYLAMARGGGRT